MRKIIVEMALFSVFVLFGCAAIEPGLGNKLAYPPQVAEVEIGTEDGKYQKPVLVSSLPHIKPVTEVFAPVESTFSFSGSHRQHNLSAWERTNPIFLSAENVPTLNDGALRNHLLMQKLHGKDNVSGFPTPSWSTSGTFRQGRSHISLNTFGRSNHYYVAKQGEYQEEENGGWGIKMEIEKDLFFEKSTFFLEANGLKNTKKGLALTVCPGMEVPLFETLGFTLSSALATCAGTYHNKEDGRTLPILAFMPGFSLEDEYGTSVRFVFLLKNPLLPVGKTRASLLYMNQPSETMPSSNQRATSQNPFGDVNVGGFASFRRLFYADFEVAKPPRR